MSPSDLSFRANSAERWIVPRATLTEPGRFLALAGAVLIYAIISALLLFEGHFELSAPAEPTEIPVEIIAEPPPPPPPPPPKPAPPPPSEQPIEEKPAFDAPRPANEEKVEREAPDKVSQAPPAPPSVEPPGKDAETGKAAASEAQPQVAAKETQADPAKDKTVAEASPNGDVKQVAPPPPQLRTEPETQPQKPASAGVRLPALANVPDITFGGAAPPAPVAGGNAKARYLTIVYGMIMSRVHRSSSPRPKSKGQGEVSFVIDGKGYLTERWTTRPSGSPELDSAIFEAVGQASPFPPPPKGRPAGLKFVYQQD